jgi:hypothetical protein
MDILLQIVTSDEYPLETSDVYGIYSFISTVNLDYPLSATLNKKVYSATFVKNNYSAVMDQ